MFLGGNLRANFITKYPNVFEVLPDPCLRFFWNNYHISFWQLILKVVGGIHCLSLELIEKLVVVK